MRLPLRIIRHETSFSIRDASDMAICYVYFDKGNPGERAIRKLMSEEEAEPIAKQIARALTEAEREKAAASPKEDGG